MVAYILSNFNKHRRNYVIKKQLRFNCGLEIASPTFLRTSYFDAKKIARKCKSGNRPYFCSSLIRVA